MKEVGAKSTTDALAEATASARQPERLLVLVGKVQRKLFFVTLYLLIDKYGDCYYTSA